MVMARAKTAEFIAFKGIRLVKLEAEE